MPPFACRGLALATALAIVAMPALSARADEDDYRGHHDNGRHRGWYKHHHDEGPRVYYEPQPVYLAPPPPIYVVPPPPVVYAPAPVYLPPSLNVIVPLHFK